MPDIQIQGTRSMVDRVPCISGQTRETLHHYRPLRALRTGKEAQNKPPTPQAFSSLDHWSVVLKPPPRPCIRSLGRFIPDNARHRQGCSEHDGAPASLAPEPPRELKYPFPALFSSKRKTTGRSDSDQGPPRSRAASSRVRAWRVY
jgi:hypothetical protein